MIPKLDGTPLEQLPQTSAWTWGMRRRRGRQRRQRRQWLNGSTPVGGAPTKRALLYQRRKRRRPTLRVGEARVPGPALSAVVVGINVTSLTGVLDCVKDLPADIVLMQEPRVPRSSLLAMQKKLQGTMFVPCEAENLVGILVKRGSAVQHHLPSLPLGWDNRVCSVLWHLDGTRPTLLVAIYGYTDGTAVQRQELSDILGLFLDWVETRGRLPCIISCDCNCSLKSLPVSPWLDICGWADIGDPHHTVLPSCGEARRIDALLVNKHVLDVTTQWRVDWTLGFATHAAQWISLQVSTPPLRRVWKRPSPYGLDDAPDMKALEHAACARNQAEWDSAYLATDVEGLWACLQSSAHAYHSAIEGKPCLPRERREMGHYALLQDYPATVSHEGDDLVEHGKATKRKRRLQQLLCLLAAKGGASGEFRQVERALQRGTLVGDKWHDWLRPSCWTSALLTQLVTESRAEEDDLLLQLRARRRNKWHTWLQEATVNDQSAIYRWIRQGAKPVGQLPIHATDDGWTFGSAALAGKADEAWWGMWQQPAVGDEGLAQWLAPLKDLPPYPTMVNLSTQRIRGVILASPGKKAPGLDGWSFKELKKWNGPLLSRLAGFYRCCELRGHWPAELLQGETVLLAKGGTDDVLDRRPITLLSCFYRIWAILRTREMREWLRSAGLDFLVGSMPGAEEQGLMMSLDFEISRIKGTRAAGIALDWSKCYDRISLNVLRSAAALAGIPQPITDLMTSIYESALTIRLGSGRSRSVVHCRDARRRRIG